MQGSKGNFSALAFEVVPSKDIISRPISLAPFEVTIVSVTRKTEIPISVTCETFVSELKNMIHHQEGIPPELQRLIVVLGQPCQMEDKGENLLHSRYFV